MLNKLHLIIKLFILSTLFQYFFNICKKKKKFKKPRPSPPASTEESSPLKADKVEESEDDGVDVKQNDDSLVRGNPLKEEIMDDIPDEDSDEEEEEEEDGLGLY